MHPQCTFSAEAIESPQSYVPNSSLCALTSPSALLKPSAHGYAHAGAHADDRVEAHVVDHVHALHVEVEEVGTASTPSLQEGEVGACADDRSGAGSCSRPLS